MIISLKLKQEYIKRKIEKYYYHIKDIENLI